MCNYRSKFFNKHNSETFCHGTAPNCVLQIPYSQALFHLWVISTENMKAEMMKKEEKKEEYVEEEQEVQVLVDPATRALLRKKYSFFVDSKLGKAIFQKEIMLKNHDHNWMAGQ